jgi:hypothetical protein
MTQSIATINNISCFRSIHQHTLYHQGSVEYRIQGSRMTVILLFKQECEILPEYFYIEIFGASYFMTKAYPILNIVFPTRKAFVSNPTIKFKHIISHVVFYEWKDEKINLDIDGLGNSIPVGTKFFTEQHGIIDASFPLVYSGKAIPIERYLDVLLSFRDSELLDHDDNAIRGSMRGSNRSDEQ